MSPTTLTPAFRGLRIGLHLLLVGLTVLAVIRAYVTDDEHAAWVTAVASIFLLTHAAGRVLRTRRARLGWLATLSILWIALVWLTPEAAYIVFPLFFLYLHVLPARIGPYAVVASALWAILALGSHEGFTVGGVIGPLVAALVAIALGVGYRTLHRESSARQRLIDDLVAAQAKLSASEHEKGVLSERTRLAGEIHDTVAQGLSSIQMLLHAAERANPDGAGIEHVRLARETAADNLAEARRFVRELTPPTLVDAGLPGALHRLAGPTSASVHIRGEVRTLPMSVETALLRIAQGAVANVDKHASSETTSIELSYLVDGVRMAVADDGVGFDPDAVSAPGGEEAFGFDVMRRRMSELGGRLTVESSPGQGTTVTAMIGVQP